MNILWPGVERASEHDKLFVTCISVELGLAIKWSKIQLHADDQQKAHVPLNCFHGFMFILSAIEAMGAKINISH